MHLVHLKWQFVIIYIIYMSRTNVLEGMLDGIVLCVLDCDILGSKFELPPHHYIPFRVDILGKGMKPPTMD